MSVEQESTSTGNGRSILANGGVIVVIGGRTTNFPQEYREHPQLVFWDSTEQYRPNDLPANTKAIVFTRFVDHALSTPLYKIARERGIVFTPPEHGTGKVKETIDHFLGVSPVVQAKKVIAAKGQIKTLVEEHCDFTKATSDEARRLFDIARSQNIPTSVESIAQAIGNIRRQKGLTGTPAVMRAKLSQTQQAVNTLNDAIAGLEILRDFVRDTEAENVNLKAQLAEIREGFSKFFTTPTTQPQHAAH